MSNDELTIEEAFRFIRWYYPLLLKIEDDMRDDFLKGTLKVDEMDGYFGAVIQNLPPQSQAMISYARATAGFSDVESMMIVAMALSEETGKWFKQLHEYAKSHP